MPMLTRSRSVLALVASLTVMTACSAAPTEEEDAFAAASESAATTGRGRVVLLVAESMASRPALVAHEMVLAREGYSVRRQVIPNSVVNLPEPQGSDAVRAILRNVRNESAVPIKSVLLIGKMPIPQFRTNKNQVFPIPSVFYGDVDSVLGRRGAEIGTIPDSYKPSFAVGVLDFSRVPAAGPEETLYASWVVRRTEWSRGWDPRQQKLFVFNGVDQPFSTHMGQNDTNISNPNPHTPGPFQRGGFSVDWFVGRGNDANTSADQFRSLIEQPYAWGLVKAHGWRDGESDKLEMGKRNCSWGRCWFEDVRPRDGMRPLGDGDPDVLMFASCEAGNYARGNAIGQSFTAGGTLTSFANGAPETNGLIQLYMTRLANGMTLGEGWVDYVRASVGYLKPPVHQALCGGLDPQSCFATELGGYTFFGDPTMSWKRPTVRTPPRSDMASDFVTSIRPRYAADNLAFEIEASGHEGARVVLWGPHGGANQKWRMLLLERNRFLLRAEHSGKCLYREPNRSLTTRGCNPDEPGEIFETDRDGTLRLPRLNECVDVPNFSRTWGQQIFTHRCKGDGENLDNQQFFLR